MDKLVGCVGPLPARTMFLSVSFWAVWLASATALAAGPEIRPAPPAVNRPPLAAPRPAVGQGQVVTPGIVEKIKLHRNAKGDYTWDISGDSVDEILRIDRKLKKAMVSSE